MKPLIIIDKHIPYIKGVLEHKAHVEYLSAENISRENIKNAQALIIRTRTKCDEHLLKNTAVKYIATATIGHDHIDKKYCKKNNIKWSNAVACNSSSVLQYVAASLMFLQKEKNIKLSSLTLGIIGVGNIGKLVADFGEKIGLKVLLNDPPREKNEKNKKFVSLKKIQEEADIITFHVPLNMEGEDKTYHMGNEHFFSNLKKKPYLINAARGEVCKTADLIHAKKKEQISGLILDCWENEPNIHTELLKMADIATPHIAGYSAEGKAKASSLAVQYISQCLNLGLNTWEVTELPLPKQETLIDLKDKTNFLSQAVLHSYDIEKESLYLKNNPEKFEAIRKNYPIRREFSSYSIKTNQILTDKDILLLKEIGFKLID